MSDGVSNDRPVQPPPPPPPPPKVNETAASEKVGADKAAAEGAQQAQQQTRALEPAKVEGAAAVQQSAGEKFSQFKTGQAGAPSADAAGPSLAPRTSQRTEAAKAEAAPAKSTEEVRKAATERQLNDAADKLAKDSPTAKALLDKFRAEGGKIEDGGKAGYFKDAKDGNPPTIGIPTKTPLGTPTSEQQRQQTIAHELGHFDHARNNPPGVVQPRNDGGGHSDATIEARREANYVQKNAERHLGDEAHATQVNAKIRDEVKAKTGNDIGVSGVRPGQPVPSKQDLVDHYGRLNPSTQPKSTYRDYYNQPYRDHYQKYFTPGGSGNL